MAREQALNARKQRNAALVETMLLAAMADGAVSQREMQTLLRRVIERPEFEGTRPEELNALVEDLGKEIPNVRQSLLAAMGNVRPSHLLDRNLFDFSSPDAKEEAATSNPQPPEGSARAWLESRQ